MQNDKPSPVCTECTGWMYEVRVKDEDWMKCGTCGHMKKTPKRVVTIVGN